MIVVNFFGAPGSGKTSAALGFAGLLKRRGHNAEYVSEFAKDQVWADSSHMLLNQNWVFANQELKLSLLRPQIDIVATDSPLPLSVFYAPKDYPESFSALCFHFFEQYQNVNIFLRRAHDYSGIGRIQSELEAAAMEESMRGFLESHAIPFCEVPSGEADPEGIYARLAAQGMLGP